jgi:hypothetical protein
MKLFISILLVIIIIFTGCDNPAYESPKPGIIEVHLKATSGAYTVTSKDSLTMTIAQLRTTREDSAFANIYDNVNALADYTDNVNIIDALDKEIVIGQMYLPPNHFVNLLISVGAPTLFVYGKRRITVTTASDYDALQILPVDFKIEENKTTLIKITCNLDSMLIKRAEGYEFYPKFKIEK